MRLLKNPPKAPQLSDSRLENENDDSKRSKEDSVRFAMVSSVRSPSWGAEFGRRAHA